MSTPLPPVFAYFVTYELTQAANLYTPLFEELKKSEKWLHHISNTWIVLRKEALTDLGTKLRQLIFQPDRLLIMPAKGPAEGWMPADAWGWIYQNVPNEWNVEGPASLGAIHSI